MRVWVGLGVLLWLATEGQGAGVSPRPPARASAVWGDTFVTVDAAGQVLAFRQGRWQALPVAGAEGLAAFGERLVVLRRGELLELDGAGQVRGRRATPPGALAVALHEHVTFLAVVTKPWHAGVVAWNHEGQKLWERTCSVPPNETENHLLTAGTAHDRLNLWVMQVVRVAYQGGAVWLLFPNRNLWVRVGPQSCEPVRWQSPRWTADPEERRWREAKMPGPLPTAHFLGAAAVPQGFVMVPFVSVPQWGNRGLANALLFVDGSGTLQRVVPLVRLGVKGFGGLASQGELLYLWDEEGGVYRWSFGELLAAAQP
ncbi:MAG: hypothetical protein NZ869_06700 [Thermoanaerobaculum sp.]|nr:hypothetical protein [Thermoanaerobaculum sp.]MDW7967944.1 hypothetical protein [Thermoanaerobaculum sp.]